ncbi:MAG: GNAT family N-acetyltransferase [Novosphingobium sp.]
MILRSAKFADIPALSRLATESFVAKFGPLYKPADLTVFLEDMLSERVIAQELANPERVYRLAEAGGELLGYCKIGLSCGFPEDARGNRVMELKQLYTSSAATGQGIGTLLMDWAMEQFRSHGADEVQLSVFAYNDGAHRFYQRYGFEKVADITFQVGEQHDPEFLFARML